MVVCKCRKATKLYCFVHKVPVCGECICFLEHQICVIRTYSEWVIDGDYDWPPKCCQCQDVLQDGANSSTTRLGCLHVIHSNCLSSHIKSFPPHTAPAGYVCPLCSTSIWPPKSIKDSASLLHSKLKEAIIQTGMEKNLFGNHPVSQHEFRGPPPAFDSDPLVNVGDGTEATQGYPPVGGTNIIEIDGSTSAANFTKNPSPIPGATTRKGAFHVDREENSYHTDDEDGKRKKYSRRGPFHHKFLRALLPFWSSALPTLPVTAPPRKDASNAEDVPESRQRQKSSRMDPRKILLVIAIIACMTTMGVLYYRLAQQGHGEHLSENEQL